MGGMALGAWTAKRISPRVRGLLTAYAVIEVVISVTVLVFYNLFVAATGVAFDRVIPALGTLGAVQAFKCLLAPDPAAVGVPSRHFS